MGSAAGPTEIDLWRAAALAAGQTANSSCACSSPRSLCWPSVTPRRLKKVGALSYSLQSAKSSRPWFFVPPRQLCVAHQGGEGRRRVYQHISSKRKSSNRNVTDRTAVEKRLQVGVSLNPIWPANHICAVILWLLHIGGT